MAPTDRDRIGIGSGSDRDVAPSTESENLGALCVPVCVRPPLMQMRDDKFIRLHRCSIRLHRCSEEEHGSLFNIVKLEKMSLWVSSKVHAVESIASCPSGSNTCYS